MTQPVELNLASRPFRNNMPLWVAYGIGALLVGWLTFWNVRTYVDHGRRMEELEAQLSSVQRKMGELQVREATARKDIAAFDVKYLRVQAQKANDVIARRALSWTKLFNLLEKIQPYEVKLSSIRPLYGLKQDGGSEPVLAEKVVPVSVEGAAQDLRAFAEYEQNLITDPHFAHVEPQRTTFGRNGELLFELRFLYAPEGETFAPPETLAASEAPTASPSTGEEAATEEELVGADADEPDPLAPSTANDAAEGARISRAPAGGSRSEAKDAGGRPSPPASPRDGGAPYRRAPKGSEP